MSDPRRRGGLPVMEDADRRPAGRCDQIENIQGEIIANDAGGENFQDQRNCNHGAGAKFRSAKNWKPKAACSSIRPAAT